MSPHHRHTAHSDRCWRQEHCGSPTNFTDAEEGRPRALLLEQVLVSADCIDFIGLATVGGAIDMARR